MPHRLCARALVLAACLCAGAVQATAPASNEALFQRLSALAPAGNAEVAYNLGMFLNNGIGTARDNVAAFRYFSQAAEAGHALAAYKVGCYYAGQFRDVVPVDAALALKFKLRAAEAGYDLAQRDVGAYQGKTGDTAQALAWFERAARQGDAASTALLAQHFAGDASPDKVKGLALLKLLKERMPQPSAQLLERIAAVEAGLTADQRGAAEREKSSWGSDPTPLTRQARGGMAQVPALLAALEQ
ncbi:MAG TPA: hypothetical protein VGE36_00340 [Roseateles sp.]